MALREDIQKRVEIMQAWLDGKTIQWYIRGDWADCDPDFSFQGHIYRIKPEPREIWVNEQHGMKGFCGLVYPAAEVALIAAMGSEHIQREAVHYREVIEDEKR